MRNGSTTTGGAQKVQAEEGSRLLVRTLGWLQGYSTLLGVMIGSGIFTVMALAAKGTGPSAPLAYVALLPVILASALGYAVFTSTPLGQRPGGAYLHISRTFGHYYPGFLVMWLQWAAYICSTNAIALSFGQYFATLLPSIPPLWSATGILVLFFVIHFIGVRVYGWVQTVMTGLLLLSIAVLVIPGFFHLHGAYFHPFFPHGAQGFFSVLPTLFFSYLGFEALAQQAGETTEPEKTLPRIFLIGVGSAVIIYGLMALVAVGNVPTAQLANASAPMVMVARQYLPAFASLLVTIGFLFAFITSVAGNMLAPARMLMTFAEDRVGPKVLAHIQPRFRTPDIALITGLVIGLVLLWTQSFLFMLNAALVAMMLLYIVHTITLALLPFVNPKLYRSARLRPHPALLIAAAVVAAGAMGWMCYKTVAQVWWLLLAWAAVGTLLYGISIVLGRREGHDYGEVRRIPSEIGDQR